MDGSYVYKAGKIHKVGTSQVVAPLTGSGGCPLGNGMAVHGARSYHKAWLVA